MVQEFLETAEEMTISKVGQDSCLIQTKNSTIVLSYDAAYGIVLRLAAWLDHVQATPHEHDDRLH